MIEEVSAPVKNGKVLIFILLDADVIVVMA